MVFLWCEFRVHTLNRTSDFGFILALMYLFTFVVVDGRDDFSIVCIDSIGIMSTGEEIILFSFLKRIGRKRGKIDTGFLFVFSAKSYRDFTLCILILCFGLEEVDRVSCVGDSVGYFKR